MALLMSFKRQSRGIKAEGRRDQRLPVPAGWRFGEDGAPFIRCDDLAGIKRAEAL
ncbi:hypothetical protein [Aestuariicoccus sp. MJ-SS9]|uniref:hypothetical protein n=1 Tax=Aestuariicoccus sp. MJ-SS9 TaxID=3079855 RepID=UPI0029089000|nr:hypothetical protein [Aestuariicoccus sp. MJ-SS9]MDU8911151.1 hypothetical protein [Aestuariicoccus sp. MJ-SS9]